MIPIRQFPHRPNNFSELFEEYGAGSITRLPAHHNGGLEIHYIAKGHLHWEIEGHPFLLAPQSVFFTFPWEKHGSCVDFEPGHFFHFVVFRVQNEAEDRPEKLRLLDQFGLGESEQQEIFSKLARVDNRCFFASPGFTLAMTRLTRELEQPGIMSQTSVIALSRLVLCELVRSLDSLEIRNNKRNSVTIQRIVKFVAELGARCPEPWTLDSMASACGLGRTRFESLIKELTGDGPSYLLSRLRVRQSLAFLKNSDKSITDIAFDCGFTTSQYFAQVFKRLVGMTPSEYRRGGQNLAAYDEHFLKALARLKTEHSNGNGPKRSLRAALAV